MHGGYSMTSETTTITTDQSAVDAQGEPTIPAPRSGRSYELYREDLDGWHGRWGCLDAFIR